MSDAAQQTNKANCYNLGRRISGIKTDKTGTGQTWLSAKLRRSGDKRDHTVCAFGQHADDLIARFRDGDEVKVFGYFRPKTFQPADRSKPITFQQFRILWSGTRQQANPADTAGQRTSARA